jgi:hypothetical protein
MAQDPLFRETQRIRQPWIWALLVLASVPVLVFSSVIGLFVILTVAAFFYSIQLITEVRPDGIYVRFAPIHRSFRRLSFAQIEGLIAQNLDCSLTAGLESGGQRTRWPT